MSHTLLPSIRRYSSLACCCLLIGGSAHAQAVRPAISPRIDSSAVALLNQAQRSLLQANTMRGNVTTTYRHNGAVNGTPSTVSLLAKKPNLLRLSTGKAPATPAVSALAVQPAPSSNAKASTPEPAASSGSKTLADPSGIIKRGNSTIITGDALLSLMGGGKGSAPPETRLYANGKALSYVIGKDTALGLDPAGYLHEAAEEGVQGFFTSRNSRVGQWNPERLSDLLLRSVTMVGPQVWDGVNCTVVDWTYEHTYTLPSDTIVYTTRFCIGATGQIQRARTTGSNGYETDRVYDLQLDAPIDDSAFALAAVAEGKSVFLKPRLVKQEKTALVGQALPALTPGAALLDEGPLAMDALLKDAKAVVLWLWAYNCSSCREEFPVAELLARTWNSKGVKFAAIDYAPGDEEYARGVRAFNRAQMPIIIGATSWYETMQANSSTVVVLDGKGVIRYQGLFNREAIENALASVKETARR